MSYACAAKAMALAGVLINSIAKQSAAVSLGVDDSAPSASEMGPEQTHRYCSDNWGTRHGRHTKESLASCKQKCQRTASCKAISFSRPEGNKCILCDTTTLSSHPNWGSFIKAASAPSPPPSPPSGGGGGGRVTCWFTADNYINDVYYNGGSILSSVSGNKRDWQSTKSVTITPVPNAYLAISASDAERGECRTADFAMTCDNGFTTNDTSWQVVRTSGSTKTGGGGGWTSPCKAPYARGLNGNPAVKKIWLNWAKSVSFRAKIPAGAASALSNYDEVGTGICQSSGNTHGFDIAPVCQKHDVTADQCAALCAKGFGSGGRCLGFAHGGSNQYCGLVRSQDRGHRGDGGKYGLPGYFCHYEGRRQNIVRGHGDASYGKCYKAKGR